MGIHVQKFKRVRIFITCVWIMHGEVRIDCWCQLLDKTKVFKLAERKSEMALKSRCVSGGRVSVTPAQNFAGRELDNKHLKLQPLFHAEYLSLSFSTQEFYFTFLCQFIFLINLFFF